MTDSQIQNQESIATLRDLKKCIPISVTIIINTKFDDKCIYTRGIISIIQFHSSKGKVVKHHKCCPVLGPVLKISLLPDLSQTHGDH